MAAVCEICDKRPHFSYQVSFSHRRTKRRWNPNIQRIRIWDGKRTRRADVCTSCMKAGKVQRPPQRTTSSADTCGVILIDPPLWRWRGQRWSHLVSDSHFDELHAFAAQLGLRRAWFQGDHYDVPEQLWDRAVALGADHVSSRDLVRRLRAAGLRRPRRQR